MGDDVKITVIATGFRQESSRAHRQMMAERMAERSLAERGPTAPPLPASGAKPAAPRFASELEEEADSFGQPGRRAHGSADFAGQPSFASQTSLASQSRDQEFFFDSEPIPGPIPVVTVAGSGRSNLEARFEGHPAPVASPNWPPPADFFNEPVSSSESFGHRGIGAAVAYAAPVDERHPADRDPAHMDTLDIPAYLRRGGN
jgi:cell division protein FtsZ